MTRRQRILHRLTWLLVATIGAIAFTASFEAIADYAGQVGWGSRMKYAAPLLVDTFTVAAGLVILARAEDGVRAVYAWSLLVVASGVSIGLNIAHAPGGTAARFVAALPPAALLAAVELAMSEARRSRSKPAPVVPPAGVGERGQGVRPTVSPGPASRDSARAAASSPRVRPQPNREGEAHAPGGTDRSAERARLFREHATESKRSLIARARAAGVGTSSERMSTEIDQAKAHANGSAPKVEVGA